MQIKLYLLRLRTIIDSLISIVTEMNLFGNKLLNGKYLITNYK